MSAGSAAPAGAAGPAGSVPSRVLPLLLALGLAAALGLAFITVAPNRLTTGRGVPLMDLHTASRWAVLPPLALMVIAACLRPGARRCWMVLAAVSMLLGALAWTAGDAARHLALHLALQTAAQAQAAGTVATARFSLGAAFWCLMLLAWLAAVDALQRLGLVPWRRAAAHLALWLPAIVLLLLGRLDELSILKEWAQREDVFGDALARHLQIVAAALVPALLLGLPLAVMAVRHARFGRVVLALLGIVQTVPAIALFALLIAPLAALGALWPGSGIQGVGLAPALVALVVYALLPIVASVAAALKQIEPGVIEAATGMGLGRARRLWQVELPLALPSLFSALRVAAVQLVGLAVVAALIGAGGLGSLIFQGLAGSALDLVLLGVVPVVVMAVVLDALLGTLAAASQRKAGGRP